MGVPLTFSDPVFASVLERGEIDRAWLAAFDALPAIDDDPSGWRPEDFRLRHYVAMYLPLRYQVWSASTGRRNEATEDGLGALILSIGRALWQGAAAVPRPPGSALVEMVLGAGHPLRLTDAAYAEWQRRYLAVLEGMRSEWRARARWPRWEAMALHAASFYLPLGLPPRSVGSTPSRFGDRPIEGLAPAVHEDVVALIEAWLAHAGSPRDSAGIPLAGWPRRDLRGRTTTEALLLDE